MNRVDLPTLGRPTIPTASILTSKKSPRWGPLPILSCPLRMMAGMDLAAHIDHTLLKPTATPEEVLKAAEEALEYGFYGLCIPLPSWPWCAGPFPMRPSAW